MRAFSRLYQELDQTTKTTRKVEVLVRYLSTVDAEEAAWALFFLCGEKLRGILKTRDLRYWAAHKAGIDDWLFGECYEIVGDLAETIALVLPPPSMSVDFPLHHWVTERIEPLRNADEICRWRCLDEFCDQLESHERFVLLKLLTGGLRVGVSKGIVTQSLAKFAGLSTDVVAHRLMGAIQPSSDFFQYLINGDTRDADSTRPYPFYLAHPWEGEIADLGNPNDWCVEWKWDGIRAQMIVRDSGTAIWSRGEEMIGDQFPELHQSAQKLPKGTVVDGEIVAAKEGVILSFSELQRRLNRKKVGKKLLQEVPVQFIAFDLLEDRGYDTRAWPLRRRRARLADILHKTRCNEGDDASLSLSLNHLVNTWDEVALLRQQCREYSTEGLMLKKWDGAYRVGRPRGEWWKWKVAPLTVDAVLLYAQRGHGRRANLYSDYTFALWDGDQLIPFAKAYSGLTDAEIRKVDAFVRANTLQRFGPVRSVKTELVFELGFENIQESSRHKSGIAVRFPRILRWRTDLNIQDADTLEMIRGMMAKR